MSEPEEPRVVSEPKELPRTKMPMLAGVLLIIAMVLFLATAAVIYYTASNIGDMEGEGHVSGYIKETYRGEKVPVSDVKVSVEGTNISTYTDSTGYYEIENTPVGVRKIIYEKPGYRVATYKTIIFSQSDLDANNQESNNFSLPGITREGFEFAAFDRESEFIEEVYVNGTFRIGIMNETGAPVSGLEISYVQSTESGPVATGYSFNITTNTAGEVSLNHTPGRYLLNISRPGYQTILQEILISPGIDAELTLTLTPGAGIIDNKIQRTGTISGKVQTPDGEAIADVTVEIEGADISVTTNPAGEYTLTNVPVGAKIISISRIGYSAVSAELFLDEDITADYNLSKLSVQKYDNSDVSGYYQCAVTYIVIALMLLAGGFAALRRKSYGLAMVAAAFGILGPIPFLFGPIPCITAVISLIALIAVYFSRREFS